jgi:tRNA G18 (ribose-2'-O)-methylase SpoU
VPIVELRDAADPRVADYRGVRDPALARDGGYFIAEGRQVVAELLAGGRFAARSVLVTPTARDALGDTLAGALDARPNLPVYLAPPPLVQALSGFHIHQGCLAIGERGADAPWTTVAEAPRLLALEAVGNPDNVGGIFRNARALGAGGVLLGPGCADPLYRKAIRTSMGAALAVPFAHVGDLTATLAALATGGHVVMAATPAAGARPLGEVAAAVAGRSVAVVLGHEGDGLSAGALAACATHVRIPMVTGVDSINVATAAAVVLYELARHG